MSSCECCRSCLTPLEAIGRVSYRAFHVACDGIETGRTPCTGGIRKSSAHLCRSFAPSRPPFTMRPYYHSLRLHSRLPPPCLSKTVATRSRETHAAPSPRFFGPCIRTRVQNAPIGPVFRLGHLLEAKLPALSYRRQASSAYLANGRAAALGASTRKTLAKDRLAAMTTRSCRSTLACTNHGSLRVNTIIGSRF